MIKSHFNGQFNLAHLTDIPASECVSVLVQVCGGMAGNKKK